MTCRLKFKSVGALQLSEPISTKPKMRLKLCMFFEVSRDMRKTIVPHYYRKNRAVYKSLLLKLFVWSGFPAKSATHFAFARSQHFARNAAMSSCVHTFPAKSSAFFAYDSSQQKDAYKKRSQHFARNAAMFFAQILWPTLLQNHFGPNNLLFIFAYFPQPLRISVFCYSTF